MCMVCVFTLLSKAHTEVIGHLSAGIGGDWMVVVRLSPLDQVLGARGQGHLGGFGHLHPPLRTGANVNGV